MQARSFTFSFSLQSLSDSMEVRAKKMKSHYALNKNKYLLDFEHSKLIELLDHFENQNLRDILLIRLALFTGARATELLNIQVNDFDPSPSVYIKGIKGSSDREIPLKKAFYNQIQSYIQTKEIKPTDRLFSISYPRLVQIWINYRPTEKKFHSLRHTFAIHLYKKTKDIRLLQFALGHRNIANTMIYANYLYSQEELRRLIL